MREITEISRRFAVMRAAWKSADQDRPGSRAAVTLGARVSTLAWVLGLDLEIMDRPKTVPGIPIAPQVNVTRLDQLVAPAAGVWWLVEFPPTDHVDGTRSELWAAFLSDAQLRELRMAIQLADQARDISGDAGDATGADGASLMSGLPAASVSSGASVVSVGEILP